MGSASAALTRTQLRRRQRTHAMQSYKLAKDHLSAMVRPVPSRAVHAAELESFRQELYGSLWQLLPSSTSPILTLPAAPQPLHIGSQGCCCTWCGTWAPIPVQDVCGHTVSHNATGKTLQAFSWRRSTYLPEDANVVQVHEDAPQPVYIPFSELALRSNALAAQIKSVIELHERLFFKDTAAEQQRGAANEGQTQHIPIPQMILCSFLSHIDAGALWQVSRTQVEATREELAIISKRRKAEQYERKVAPFLKSVCTAASVPIQVYPREEVAKLVAQRLPFDRIKTILYERHIEGMKSSEQSLF